MPRSLSEHSPCSIRSHWLWEVLRLKKRFPHSIMKNLPICAIILAPPWAPFLVWNRLTIFVWDKRWWNGTHFCLLCVHINMHLELLWKQIIISFIALLYWSNSYGYHHETLILMSCYSCHVPVKYQRQPLFSLFYGLKLRDEKVERNEKPWSPHCRVRFRIWILGISSQYCYHEAPSSPSKSVDILFLSYGRDGTFPLPLLLLSFLHSPLLRKWEQIFKGLS